MGISPTSHPLLLPTCIFPPLPYPPRSHQLECVYQLHSAAINCIVIRDGLCVTGSDDRMLRVWPTDFSDFLLEVGWGGWGVGMAK